MVGWLDFRSVLPEIMNKLFHKKGKYMPDTGGSHLQS
jgi:hypothetical protein